MSISVRRSFSVDELPAFLVLYFIAFSSNVIEQDLLADAIIRPRTSSLQVQLRIGLELTSNKLKEQRNDLKPLSHQDASERASALILSF